MTTPELLQYIRSQYALGQTREAISDALKVQGWGERDIQEAMNQIAPVSTASVPTSQQNLNQQPVQTAPLTPVSGTISTAQTGASIGKIIFWIFVIGFIGLIISGSIFAYYVYSNISNLPHKICEETSSKDRANCEQMVKNFFGFLIKDVQTNKSYSNNKVNPLTGTEVKPTDCTGGFTDRNGTGGIGDITALVGINDPVICYYSQPADLNGISKITMEITGSPDSMKGDDSVKIVSEINEHKVTVFKKNGSSTTFEASTSSPVFFATSGMHLNVMRLEIPLLQMCIKSTNWNTSGSWFTCDKVTFMGVTVSENDPNNPVVSAINMNEVGATRQTAFFLETRSIEKGKFTAHALKVDRDGRLLKYTKKLTIYNYKGGSNLMTDKSIEEVWKSNPEAEYSDIEFSYER